MLLSRNDARGPCAHERTRSDPVLDAKCGRLLAQSSICAASFRFNASRPCLMACSFSLG